jgi:hypothetical protein
MVRGFRAGGEASHNETAIQCSSTLTKRLKNAETLSKASAQDKGLCAETTPFFDVDRAWDAHALQS